MDKLERAKERLKYHLSYMAAGVIPKYKRHGICYNLNFAVAPYLLYPRFNWKALDDKYPYFSGNRLYVVAHPHERHPGVAYCESKNVWIGEYGRRRRLLAKLILENFDDVVSLKEA